MEIKKKINKKFLYIIKNNTFVMQKFTEKVEYVESQSLMDQGEIARMLMDVKSYLENRILKEYDKKDINKEIVEQIITKINDSTDLVKNIFK